MKKNGEKSKIHIKGKHYILNVRKDNDFPFCFVVGEYLYIFFSAGLPALLGGFMAKATKVHFAVFKLECEVFQYRKLVRWEGV